MDQHVTHHSVFSDTVYIVNGQPVSPWIITTIDNFSGVILALDVKWVRTQKRGDRRVGEPGYGMKKVRGQSKDCHLQNGSARAELALAEKEKVVVTGDAKVTTKD